MTIAERRIPSIRLVPTNAEVLDELGPLANLVGTWEGRGFNLIARPDFHDQANLYLQLNHTHENLRVSSIGSAIPNRGFGQDDINLYGTDYLDKISDVSPPEGTGGALHLEPGLWVYQPDPATTFPAENVDPAQLVHRMATIPHGNAVLASGIAQPFTGAPTLATADATYNGSLFPSFNSTPFGAGGPLNAAGSSDAATAAANPGVIAPFNQYDLGVKADQTNPRTPFPATTPELPDFINGVAMQDLINDPILLLQAQIKRQQDNGDEFEGTVINIASQATVKFNTKPNAKIGGPVQAVTVPGADGGVENILFLDGTPNGGKPVNNAHTALVYATFWITTVHPQDRPPYQQLQYAQMVELDFPIFKLLHPADGTPPVNVDLGWPHITVATLRKSFNS
jgi:hypothetical protein